MTSTPRDRPERSRAANAEREDPGVRRLSELSERAPRTVLVLIHGVGLPGERTFGTGRFRELVQIDRVQKLDWHKAVEPPFLAYQDRDHSDERSFLSRPLAYLLARLPLLNFRQIRQLMRGLIGSFGRTQTVDRVHDVLLSISLRLLLLAPVFLLWSLQVGADQLHRATAGDPALSLIATTVQPLRYLMAALAPLDVLRSARWILLTYATVVLILLSVALLWPLLRTGPQRLLVGLRQLVIAIAWPTSFLAAILCSPIVPFLLGLYLVGLAWSPKPFSPTFAVIGPNLASTIAVLGTPLSETYPRENRALQAAIAERYLVISQVPVWRYSQVMTLSDILEHPAPGRGGGVGHPESCPTV